MLPTRVSGARARPRRLKLTIEDRCTEVPERTSLSRAKVTVAAKIMGSILIGIGCALVITSTLFDLFLRLRMFFIVRDRKAFLRNGPDWGIYSRYRAAAKVKGWAAWPVNAIWALLGSGAVVLIAGAIASHGWNK
jgi:hypothetical protein